MVIAVLRIEDVTCGYGGAPVVEGFSANVETGELFFMLGPNGVGKTTLFKTVLGLLSPIAGRVVVDGRDASTLTRREFARLVSYVPQAQVPPFAFSVIDVVALGRIAHVGEYASPKDEDYAIAYAALERLGIERLQSRTYTELSGGERQMVMIARAIAQDPLFLMMDEPTANLDFSNQMKVLRVSEHLAAEGIGIIMTTHFPDHVFLCNASVGLLFGRCDHVCGPAEAVLTEENLRRAYGIPVRIVESDCDGECVRHCHSPGT